MNIDGLSRLVNLYFKLYESVPKLRYDYCFNKKCNKIVFMSLSYSNSIFTKTLEEGWILVGLQPYCPYHGRGFPLKRRESFTILRKNVQIKKCRIFYSFIIDKCLKWFPEHKYIALNRTGNGFEIANRLDGRTILKIVRS